MFTKKNIGENIDDKDLNEILKRIYDSTFFEDVKVSIKENTLKIVVLENPLVENVEIKGPKAKKIVEELKKNLQVKARTSYNEISLLKDKKKITEILKQKGYFFSKVDVIVESLSDNKVNLIYNVEIGDKAKIKKISFIGDKIFKDRKLRSIIVSEEYKFWKFISGKKFSHDIKYTDFTFENDSCICLISFSNIKSLVFLKPRIKNFTSFDSQNFVVKLE